jgi:aspartyl/glutamyl-tRNA(Asn/Gln) amidotransferase C subunit
MPLNDQQLSDLAALARLAEPERPAALREDLARILAYVERLAAFDDPLASPLRHPNLDGDDSDRASLRPDRPAQGMTTAELESLAPRWREGRFEVPRTVDHD